MVERLFLVVPQGCLRFVIVVFPDHTHLLFFMKRRILGMVSTINNLTFSLFPNVFAMRNGLFTLYYLKPINAWCVCKQCRTRGYEPEYKYLISVSTVCQFEVIYSIINLKTLC